MYQAGAKMSKLRQTPSLLARIPSHTGHYPNGISRPHHCLEITLDYHLSLVRVMAGPWQLQAWWPCSPRCPLDSTLFLHPWENSICNFLRVHVAYHLTLSLKDNFSMIAHLLTFYYLILKSHQSSLA